MDCGDGTWLIVFLITMHRINLTVKPTSTHVPVKGTGTIKRQDGYVEFHGLIIF